MIKAKNPADQHFFDFLYQVRKSGQINMFAAPSVMVDKFGITLKESREAFIRWTEEFKE
jgi:hypothetical protein